jgi:hypothetical protein
MSDLVLLTEVHNSEQREWSTSPFENESDYSLRQVILNTDHVVLVRENDSLKEKLKITGWPKGLDERVTFCKVFLISGHSASINIIGDLYTTAQKLGLES